MIDYIIVTHFIFHGKRIIYLYPYRIGLGYMTCFGHWDMSTYDIYHVQAENLIVKAWFDMV